jgi:predicted transcriptional regulator YheO
MGVPGKQNAAQNGGDMAGLIPWIEDCCVMMLCINHDVRVISPISQQLLLFLSVVGSLFVNKIELFQSGNTKISAETSDFCSVRGA